MIQTHVHYPKFPLNQFVDLIWVGHGENIQIASSHYAPMFTELIFNFDGEFTMNGQHIVEEGSQGVRYILSGLKTQPFHTFNTGLYKNIGLILKPFCYPFLLSVFNTSLLDDLVNAMYMYLQNPSQATLTQIENQLLIIFQGQSLPLSVKTFKQLADQQQFQKGDLSKFTKSISLSQKSFIKNFKHQFLITPNQYINLVRINRAITLMGKYPYLNLTQIGLDAGFYDQSHFIRLFKKFTGVTPKKFVHPTIL